MAPLDSYVPSLTQPWDRRRAAHLMRRASFGAPWDEVEAVLSQSPSDAVDAMVDAALVEPMPPMPDWYDPESPLFEEMHWLKMMELNHYWLGRVRQGGLRTKLAILWSAHFATSYEGYNRADYSWEYLTLLYQHALGNFETCVYDIGLTPAMLAYLDGNQNTRYAPNENYARELCELFTMGPGHYTQTDIEELARALTGWRTFQKYYGVAFVEDRFDPGEKSFFGETGNFGYDDVVRIIFEKRRDETATFIAGKFYQWFVRHEVSGDVVSALADRLKLENFEIAPVIRALLKSQHFFSEAVLGAQIKSPIECLYGCVREAELDLVPDFIEWSFWWMRDMGQRLFYQPDVAGWRTHRNWLSTTTLPYRWQYCRFLMADWLEHPDARLVDLAKKVTDDETDPVKITEGLMQLLTLWDLAEPDFDMYLQIFKGDIPDDEYNGYWNLDFAGAANQVRELIEFVVGRPEYQLT